MFFSAFDYESKFFRNNVLVVYFVKEKFLKFVIIIIFLFYFFFFLILKPQKFLLHMEL